MKSASLRNLSRYCDEIVIVSAFLCFLSHCLHSIIVRNEVY